MEKEIRTFGTAELREVDGKIRIEGYASVYDSLSEDLGYFREVVRPGAFDRSLDEGDDILALMDHDTSRPLARRSEKSLSLKSDTKGLKASISPGDYSYTPDLLESIRRRERAGMSFAFYVREQAWVDDQENDLLIRELRDVKLIEVSPVVFPAYPQTTLSTVSKRAIDEAREHIQKRSLPPASTPTTPFALLRRRMTLEDGE